MHDKFWTKDQIEHIRSVAFNQIGNYVIKELKKIEIKPDPHAFISFGLRVEGRSIPIIGYSEKDLEQEIKCDNCTLEYAIYGAFGFCPDCGIHNSLQILKASFSIIEKMLRIAIAQDKEICLKLMEDALINVVSSFDGYGRELCRVNSMKSKEPSKADQISFQAIATARENVIKYFGYDFAIGVSDTDWKYLITGFQKRHLLAHKMGVIDQKYVELTGCSPILIGRRVSIAEDDIRNMLRILPVIANSLFMGLK